EHPVLPLIVSTHAATTNTSSCGLGVVFQHPARSPRTMYPTVARRVSKPRGDDISASIEADRG
ncbi:MAG: hypothetical protein WA623_01960, partial [Candidatus Sulfotelmatobacter sp.]